VLRFSPTAWAKLLFLRDLGDTEVGGFGIASAEDLLLVEDVKLVHQTCTGVSVAFDDQSVADFFDDQVDRGLRPERFARIWVHTHPGNWADPSNTDEETFERVFGRTDWAVMFILARGSQSYARLRFHVGPGGDLAIPVTVDYSRPFAASDPEGWKAEYLANVEEEPLVLSAPQDAKAPANSAHNGPFEPFEPFGADAEWLNWQPDLFDELPQYQEEKGGYSL
jgi:proteasome lid subunit RPN8/RPN11